jgi:hypothetical protein
MIPQISLALVHWPCWNQHGEVVCTNITNFDIHDIARSCRSFGIHRYFLVNKIKEQLMFVHRVLDHWRVGEGSEHNHMRKTAVEMIKTAETIEEVINQMPVKPIVVSTSAQNRSEFPSITYNELKRKMWAEPQQPILIIFGTGWGLTDHVLGLCDYILEPIRGSSEDDYRHLSVRAAVAISLDRLMGQKAE